jgi:hypothetical protein
VALLFECDEDAHRATRSRYGPAREGARMAAIAAALAAPPRGGAAAGVPAVFVRVAAPRKALGGAGALWREAPALARLRHAALAAALAAARAPPARGTFRVRYVGYDSAGAAHAAAAEPEDVRVLPAAEAGADAAGGAGAEDAPAAQPRLPRGRGRPRKVTAGGPS